MYKENVNGGVLNLDGGESKRAENGRDEGDGGGKKTKETEKAEKGKVGVLL